MVFVVVWLPIFEGAMDGIFEGDDVTLMEGPKEEKEEVELGEESEELNVAKDDASDGENVGNVISCEGFSVGARVGDDDGGSKSVIESLYTFTPHVIIPLGIPGFGWEVSVAHNVPG